MLKKIYYYVYAIVQVVLNAAILVNIGKHAKEFMLGMHDAFKTYPEDMAKQLTETFTLDFAKSFLMFSIGVTILVMIAFLILVIFKRESKKKGLALGLVITSMLLGYSDIGFILSIVTIFLICKGNNEEVKKEGKVVKEKKAIQKLRPLKVSAKDIGLSILVIVAYLSQFILSEIPMGKALKILVIITYYVLMFALVIFIFAKRYKRDFGAFKENFGTYIKYIFKMWGVMLLFSLAGAIIASLLGANDVSANQEGLTNMPMWFVVPLAVIWAPVVEEGIFRGIVRRFIPNNDKLFIAVSAVLFGLIHTVGQEATLYMTFVQSIQYMAMGGVMAYTYVKSNNIFTNMGVHCVQNSFSSIMMLLMNLA